MTNVISINILKKNNQWWTLFIRNLHDSQGRKFKLWGIVKSKKKMGIKIPY